MEIGEVLKKLTEEEQKVITDAIDGERNKGIAESRKKGEEIKKHLTTTNAFRDRIKNLGLDPDDENLDDKLDALKEKVSGKKADSEIAKLQRDVKALTDKLVAKDKAEADLREKFTQKTLDGALRKAMGEKVVAADFVISGLIRDGKVKLADDDRPVFVTESGDVDFDKGVSQFLNDNPSLVKNKQPQGGDSRGGQGGAKPPKTMAKADWEQTGPKERAQFILDGGVLT